MSALYSKLIDELITKISFMEKGDKLPSERQLCKDYNVSRTTVRNAVGSLVNSGMLYQIQGKELLLENKIGKIFQIIIPLPNKQKEMAKSQNQSL